MGHPANRSEADFIIENHIEARSGTYALLLRTKRGAVIRVGHLGELRVCPGYYIYVGSAFGPGGLRARLAHHLAEPVGRRAHWHIDYLRAHTQPVEVWYCYGAPRREHHWARHIARMVGATLPLAGFGASDCRCASHVYFFAHRPAPGWPDVSILSLSQTNADGTL